ncbi:Serine carboxypeptidase-like 12 [Capsicum chinense]|nr:Serine carboxypeptidase-like 12 [Capsicum chinense]
MSTMRSQSYLVPVAGGRWKVSREFSRVKKFSCPGPLRFVEQVYNGSMPSFVLNPHAWTKIASVIFLDQPVNTGFSYATNSAAYKYTNVQACEYVYEFLRKWLSDHPQFISNPFYISGNSFAGMIVPVIAQYISNGNAAGKEPLINLQGYLLGNPAAFLGEFNYRIPFSLGMGLIPDELYKNIPPKKRAGNQSATQPEDLLGEHVSHAEFRAAFTTLSQSFAT